MSFQIASASVLGRDHVGPGKNNQDAVWVAQDSGIILAVVCDGCGSGAHSEVGAKIGARLVAAEVGNLVGDHADLLATADSPAVMIAAVNHVLRRAQDNVMAQLRVLANAMGERLTATVQDYFLFTVVGTAVSPKFTFVFGCGDGVAILNGLDLKLGLTDGTNAPPYLGYHLVGQGRGGLEAKAVIPTSELVSLVVASDGLEGLLADPEAKLPGKSDKVGLASRLWEDDKLFANPDALRRFLVLANRTSEVYDWKAQTVKREHGLLKDDTSLVVIRRKPQETK